MLARFLHQPWATATFRIAVGTMWIVAGAAKLHDFRGTPYLESFWSGQGFAFSFLLPAVELVLGISMVTGGRILAATLLSSSLLTLFTGYAVYKLATGQAPTSCGCFGAIKTPFDSGWGLLMRNASLLIFSIAACFGVWGIARARVCDTQRV
jgi:uncharacterized membrane protein YphA (DoxX/SURF4 family)